MADIIGGIEATVVLDATQVETGAARVKSAMGRIDTSMSQSGRGTANFSRGLLELSRGIEDFTTGGPIGILNNIPGIFTSMAAAAGVSATALAGLTAGVSVLATGAYILYRNWDSVTSLWEDRNPFPQSANDLDRMQDRLKVVNKELEALKALQSLDNAQLARANVLVAERTKLEKEVTAEKERQKNIDVVMKAKDPEDARRAAAIAGAIGKGEKGEAFKADLAEAFKTVLRRRGEGGDVTKMVEDLMAGLGAGDPKALARLKDIMGAGTGTLIGGPGFRARLEGRDLAAERGKVFEDVEVQMQMEEFRAMGLDQRSPFEEGQAQAERDRASVAAGAVQNRAGQDMLEAEKEKNAEQEAKNAEANDKFFKNREIADDAWRQQFPEAIRQSMVMGSSQLNASIQASISNDSPQKRMLEQLTNANASIGEIKEFMKNFGPPIRPGVR